MTDLSPLDEALLVILNDAGADSPLLIGDVVVRSDVSAKDIDEKEKTKECWDGLLRLGKLGLVKAYDFGGGARTSNHAVLTAEGRAKAYEIVVPPPSGPVVEFSQGLDDVDRAVLDVVVERELREGELRVGESDLLLGVRDRRPDVDLAAVTLTVERLTNQERLTRSPGHDEAGYQSGLGGLVGSSWGLNALAMIENALVLLRSLRRRRQFSWRELRNSAALPNKLLNLAYVSIQRAALGHGLEPMPNELTRGWTPSHDFPLVRDRSALELVRHRLARRDVPAQGEASVALVRRSISFSGRPAAGGAKAEPTMQDSDYEAILQTISHMGDFAERHPASFEAADEALIRDHILMQLNGQYEGNATGETFNAGGRTDILVRIDGGNVFIAECKFWNGPEGLTRAIEQLMGYLSWRDTKCALVIFVRDTQMSTVLAKLPEVLRRHALFKRERTVSEETWFRAELHHPGDCNREAVLTIVTFRVPRSP